MGWRGCGTWPVPAGRSALELRCPVTQFLDVHPCEDWTCPAHWVEQAWEPVSSGKRLPCLPASSKLWLGFLAGGSGGVCKKELGVAS